MYVIVKSCGLAPAVASNPALYDTRLLLILQNTACAHS